MKVGIKALNAHAIMPTYAHKGDGCFDLYAADSGSPHPATDRARRYGTGLAFAIPPGHQMFVLSRSGAGYGRAERLSNSVACIDQPYTGEVKISLHSDADRPDNERAVRGDRIAQAFIIKVEACDFEWIDDVPESDRSTNGFGSTGA